MSLRLVKQKLINHFWHFPQAVFWQYYYRQPAKKLINIGVTGTDGKTTTASLIWHILEQSGQKAGLSTSIGTKTGKKTQTTGLHVTTPKPAKLQKTLQKMQQNGCHYTVIETTSHGLDQYRLWGIDFTLGVFTNITREHLDYHKNYHNYLQTKARLVKNARQVVLNKDDQSFSPLKKIAKKYNKKIITYSLKKAADFNLEKFPFKTNLKGDYNLSNCLAAIAACKNLAVKDDTIRSAVKSFTSPEGRYQEIKQGQDFRIIIDFAHTPNALEKILKSLQKEKKQSNRLVAVFGCAGERDKEKRPAMGKIAAQNVDLAILTAEDPRRENLDNIMADITAGFTRKNYQIIKERQKAIDYAIRNATPGDIVVICGKGHEQSMCFGNKEYPWSDEKAVLKSLKKINS